MTNITKNGGLNVLSLFDGISCGQVALERANIKVDKYYASEINKKSIAVTMDNYPNTIQLGDITRWKEWDIDWSSIDLLIGGSPCQGFSFAGKQLNFKDERSKLFFVYHEILTHIKKINPNIKFLLENVKMKKEYQDIISFMLEVEPLFINSALVSAQNRPRLYWTNIKNVTIPKDRGIVLYDILEEDADFQFIESEKTKNRIYKENYMQYDINGLGHGSQDQRAYYLTGKHGCLDTGASGKAKVLCEDGEVRKLTRVECERLQTLPDNYTKAISENEGKNRCGDGWTVEVIAHILREL